MRINNANQIMVAGLYPCTGLPVPADTYLDFLFWD